MPRQLALFLTAVQFLTRLPVPLMTNFDPAWTARSARYFPLVGALVGTVSAGVLVASSQVWGGWLPALLATGVGVLLTGAFHEDGLADTADGLGGGHTSARRLEIMKDSRIGTYGALALVLALLLKAGALEQTPVWVAALTLVAAHAGGRAAAVVVMRVAPYAGDRSSTKVKPVADGVTRTEVMIGLVCAGVATVPIAIVAPLATSIALVVAAVAALAVPQLARRLIGGWTGDTLGATEQAFEIAFLVAVAGAIAR